MSPNGFYYRVEVRSTQGDRLAEVAAAPDLEPVRECARLAALRGGCLAPGDYGGPVEIEPEWHARLGEPYVGGLKASIGGTSITASLGHFQGAASQAAEQLVEAGKLAEGDRFAYLVTAFPQAPRADAAWPARFTVREAASPVAVRAGELAGFERRTVERCEPREGDLPVFLPRQVLEEVREATRAADQRETGGILIGHLRRDSEAPEMFVEVTAQAPARHAQAELAKLTFTPECWTEVRSAVELRRQGEVFVGWWHSHPVRHWKCKDCPLERQKVCGLAKDFLSADDRALHRAIFPRAYSVALVANDVAFSDVIFSLFGWRKGLIESRGFQVIE